MSKLSGGEDVAGPFFEFREDNVISWGDDTTFVDSSDELDDNFFTSVIIDDLELTNIVVFLHDSKEFNQDL